MRAQAVIASTEAIDRALPQAANDIGPCDIRALADDIAERRHRIHLRDLPYTVSLARRVERLFAGDPNCPVGLADHLSLMAADFEAYRWREESMLFPILRIGAPGCLAFVTRRMMDHHAKMDLQLMTLQRFTKRFRPSFEAPFCWQALSFLCRKLETDLSAHARLEQETLYALLKA